MPVNRIVTILTVIAGLAGALIVPLANLDTSSTVGVVGGLAVAAGAVLKWLHGWQLHEARQASPLDEEVDPATLADPSLDEPGAVHLPVGEIHHHLAASLADVAERDARERTEAAHA